MGFKMPNTVTAAIRSGEKCSNVERATFQALVLQGGEVESLGLSARIARAEALLFLLDPQFGLIGISALKHPGAYYREKVFRAANAKCAAKSFQLELGWIYLIGQHR